MNSNYFSGMVLITSLIFTTIMSLLAASSMQNTTLQERISDNAYQWAVAFQAAEVGLREGEAQLRQAVLPAYNATWFRDIPNQITAADINNCDVATFWLSAYCWDNAITINCASNPISHINSGCTSASQTIPMTLDATLKEQPRYVIERLVQLPPIGGGSLQAGRPIGGGAAQSVWRITARGVGNTGDAIVVLQSTFQR